MATTPSAQQIGERLRARREYLHYTQEDIADRLDMTKGNWSKIERGEIGISVPDLCEAASFLRVSLDYFCETVVPPSVMDNDAAEVWAAIPSFKKPVALALMRTVKDTEDDEWVYGMTKQMK